MKKTLAAFCLALLVGAGSASAAVTNVFYVAAGQTNTVKEIVDANGYTWADGDWLRKTGPGQLTASADYKATKINLLIEEGSYVVGTIVHTKGGTLIVKDGATVRVGAIKDAFGGDWIVTFAGHGTGQGDNLGAICVGGSLRDSIFGTATTWTMSSDATIYSYGTMNAVFSSASASSGISLNMAGHTLTVRGINVNAVFRPRYYWKITNAGPIIVRNGEFARHDTTNDFTPNIPLVSFTEGAVMASYATSSLWGKVDAFSFEAGTSLKKGVEGASGVSLTMKKVTGPVAISTDATVTISQEFGVRGSDLVNGKCLTSANTLTFASGCGLSFAAFGNLSLTAGTVYTAATSVVSIAGTPTPTGNAATLFTVANTGKALTLTVKSGIIDVVRDWGLQTNAASAAADNTAAVAAHVAEVADGTVLYFPPGDYWFTDTFDVSSVTAANVRLWNPEGTARLRGGVKLGAASNLTVEGLVFSECAGPAVVATNTVGLTITGCTCDKVGGAYEDGKKYLFAAVNVTGFNVTAGTYVTDGMRYDGQGFFAGGTQAALSEAYSNAVVVRVTAANYWAWWEDTTNRLALATNAYSGKTWRKIGTGTFDSNNTNIQTVGIAAIEILEGAFVVRGYNACLGKAQGPVRVHDGATLTLADSGTAASYRRITISGSGSRADFPAVRFTGTARWDKTDSVRWVLEGDATMYTSMTGEDGSFLHGAIEMNGHTLMLDGVADSHFRFGRTFEWNGGGTVIVSRTTLSASSAFNPYFRVKDGPVPTFIFQNGAKFIPDNTDIFALVKNCSFASGTQLSNKVDKTSALFNDFAGNPTIADSITNVTINGTYTLTAANMTAEPPKAPTMTGTLVLGPDATWAVDNLSALERKTYPIFTATGGIEGTLKAAVGMEAGWSVFKNGTTLYFGPPQGLILTIR